MQFFLTLLATLIGSILGVIAGCWVTIRATKQTIRETAQIEIEVRVKGEVAEQLQKLHKYAFSMPQDAEIIHAESFALANIFNLGYPFMKEYESEYSEAWKKFATYSQIYIETTGYREDGSRYSKESTKYTYEDIDRTRSEAMAALHNLYVRITKSLFN